MASERAWPAWEPADPPDPKEWPAACIGPGRVGSALTRALQTAGFPIVAVGGRSKEGVARLASGTGAATIHDPWSGLGEQARLVLVTVPDRHLAGVAARLGEGAGLRPGSLLLQASATEPAAVLAPAAPSGAAACLSFHPLRPFPDREGDAASLRGVFTALEGNEAGLAFGRHLAAILDTRSVTIVAADKTLYHAAGVLSATGVMALARAAAEVADRLDLPADFLNAAILPGMQAALEGLARHGLPDGLTGPVSRGDDGVVGRHLAALEGSDPELADLYRLLVRLNLRTAEEGGLDPEAVARLRDVLRK